MELSLRQLNPLNLPTQLREVVPFAQRSPERHDLNYFEDKLQQQEALSDLKDEVRHWRKAHLDNSFWGGVAAAVMPVISLGTIIAAGTLGMGIPAAITGGILAVGSIAAAARFNHKAQEADIKRDLAEERYNALERAGNDVAQAKLNAQELMNALEGRRGKVRSSHVAIVTDAPQKEHERKTKWATTIEAEAGHSAEYMR